MMNEYEKYEIWRTNRFDEDILSERVGVFFDLELAKDFVNYQATLGERFAVLQNGVSVD